MKLGASRRTSDEWSYDRGVGAHTSIVGLLASAAAFVLVTTGGCSSVPDITFDDAAGGSSGGPCNPNAATAEICGDGIDNDCDGRADCADRACEGRVSCVDHPSDWQVIAFAEGTRPPCPDGFGDGIDVRSVQGSAGPPSCACNCGGACSGGSVGLAFGDNPSCGDASESLDVRTDCRRLTGNADFSVGTNTFMKATAPAAPSCNGAPSAAPPPLRDSRTCKATAQGAGGCSGSSSCAPRVGNGYQLCLQKAGASECPPGFASARRVGTSAVDTRACSACTCKSSPCSVEVKLFEDFGCDTQRLSVTTSGTCSQLTNSGFNARGYAMKISGGCEAATPPQGSGSLVLTGESTVCCRSTGN